MLTPTYHLVLSKSNVSCKKSSTYSNNKTRRTSPVNSFASDDSNGSKNEGSTPLTDRRSFNGPAR